MATIFYTVPKGFSINRKTAKENAVAMADALKQQGYSVRITENKNEYRISATEKKRR